MSEPTSPPATRLRQPSWTDARLVAGILMILLSVLGGTAVVDAADRSVRVWSVRRDLPAGTTLQRDDLAATRVRLFGDDARRYLDAHGDPTGKTLTRALGEGDLLPVSALAEHDTAKRVLGIPLDRAHALGGEVRRGDVVDVLASRKTAAGTTTYAVARGVRVVDVAKPGNGLGAARGDLVVLVEVEPEQALPIAAAIRGAELDLSLVVAGADGPGDVGASPVAAP